MTEPSPFQALKQATAQKPQRLGRRILLTNTRTFNKRIAAFCGKNVHRVAQNVLFFGGLVSVSVGFGLIYLPFAPIVGGALAVWVGMLISEETAAK